MLEELARVVRVEGNQAWVETQRQSTCGACSAQRGCGTATLSKLFGNRRNVVRVLSAVQLRVGEQVVIGIRERALVRGSLAVYAVPILLLLLGGLIGELGADQFIWTNAEFASVMLGLLGLVGGLVWLKSFTRRIQNDANFQPVVLRKQTPVEMIAIE